jgi:hypothetical protein
MTDLAKAIAFATHCLKWTDAHYNDAEGMVLAPEGTGHRGFDPDSAVDLEDVLQEFLGKKLFIQTGRGTTSLFQWYAIVGWQDRTNKTVTTDNARGEGETQWAAIFDACVQAAGMFEKRET